MKKPLDFCHDKMYNIITVEKKSTSKAGKKPERRKHGRGHDK